MVDHFQHIVYEKPEMTPAERHAAWKELLGVYMPVSYTHLDVYKRQGFVPPPPPVKPSFS